MTCNGTLGSYWEQPASQVLPTYFALQRNDVDADHARLIAGWFAKVVLLASLNSWRDGEWGHDQAAQLIRPLLEGSPPPGLYVRLARFDHSEKRGLAGILPVGYPQNLFFGLNRNLGLVAEVLIMRKEHEPPWAEWTASGQNGGFATVWPATNNPTKIPDIGVSQVQIEQMRARMEAARNPAARLAAPVRRTL